MAYLYIVEEPATRGAARSVVVDEKEGRGELVVDLDTEGRVLGIEIFSPRAQLRPETLDAAERIG